MVILSQDMINILLCYIVSSDAIWRSFDYWSGINNIPQWGISADHCGTEHYKTEHYHMLRSCG